MANPASQYQAVLLLGPTGSGKTPLGNVLQSRGYRGAPCRHFDFGAELRALIVADAPPRAIVSREDIEFIRDVLARGALLEDDQFPLAERVLRAFLAEPEKSAAVVLLNGLPRHLGQATAVEAICRVDEVVALDCPPEAVLGRIQSNAGGDRAGRDDDHLELVRQKLDAYARRTRPLVAHYESRGVPIRTLTITANTTPIDMLQMLEQGSARTAK